jgi:hypothetical protein
MMQSIAPVVNPAEFIFVKHAAGMVVIAPSDQP